MAVTLAELSWNAGSRWSLVLMGLVLMLCWLWYEYRHALRHWGWFGAMLAKGIAFTLLLLCVLDPMWSYPRAVPGANLFAILVDNSASMNLTPSPQQPSRGEIVRQELNDPQRPWLVRLAQDFEVRRYQFDSTVRFVSDYAQLDFQGERSHLMSALRSLQQRLQGRPLAGVLLFTDGLMTDEFKPEDCQQLPPLYPVMWGQQVDGPDVSIVRVSTTTTAFEDAPVTLHVELSQRRLAPFEARVFVADEQGQIVKEEMLTWPRASSTQLVKFSLRPLRPGICFYRVVVHPLTATVQPPEPSPPAAPWTILSSQEITVVNNQRLVVTQRDSGPYRLLYVTGRPNWEFKFLRRALQTDDQLKMTALIRIARREAKFDFRGREGESANPLFRGFDRVTDDTARHDEPVFLRLDTTSPEELREGFPRQAAALFTYHAIILDDLEAEFFTPDQLTLLEKFVSERGGGLLVLGGQEVFRQGDYQRTLLARLLPVYLEAPAQAPPPQGYRWQLSREGMLQPWLRLRHTEIEEQQRLQRAPSLSVLNTISGIKPAAMLLAELLGPQGQQYPALVWHRYGQGRVVACLAGDLWRWQLAQLATDASQDDLSKFWRQVLRWLVVDVPSRVELHVADPRNSTAAMYQLQARILSPEFQPQDDATLELTLYPPSGEAFHQPLEPALDEPGVSTAVVASRPAGAWRAALVARDAEGRPLGAAETGWAADPLAAEFARLDADPRVYQQLAELTGGRVLTLDQLADWAQSLPAQQAPIQQIATTPLWHQPWVWGMILAGWLWEWGYRRRHGWP
ncbi:MAG: membrane protein [Planctomycetaceae bacterium]|nr:MAG: membrane protein [Planctomycetaceae bacterium]